MRKIGQLFFIFLLILIFVSCQATPETEYVVPKGDSNIEKRTEPLDSQLRAYSAPGSWEEEFPLDYFTFYFDTPVHVPDMQKYPVFSVRQRMLSAEDVETFIMPFISDTQKYAKPVFTKADIEQRIVDVKRGYYDFEQEGFVKYPDEDKIVSDLEKARQEAPEQPEYQDMSTFEVHELPLALDFFHDDQSKIQIRANNTSILIDRIHEFIMQPEAWVVNGDAIVGEPKGTLLKNVKISEAEALSQAQFILKRADLEYLSLISAEKARLVMDRLKEVTSEGWILTFGRGDGGYNPVDLSIFAGNIYRELQAEPEYSAPWNMERLQLYLDENGLQWLCWENPLESIDVLNENVALLNFSDIQFRVKQQLKNEWAWIQEKNKFYDPSQTIYDMTLSYSLLPAKNDASAAMLVPTWFVFYILNGDLEEVDAFVPSLLAINAVDGSVVNPIEYAASDGEIWIE